MQKSEEKSGPLELTLTQMEHENQK